MIKFATILALFAQVVLAKEKSGIDFNIGEIREKRGTFVYPDTDITQKARDYDRRVLHRQKVAKELGAIKLDIINGNYEKAQIRLLRARYGDDFSLPIQLRYLAMLHFVEGHYQKSLELLERKEMERFSHQDNVCLLKTLNLIILDRAADAQSEWKSCESYLIGKDGGSNIWMNALLRLKLQQESATAAKVLDGLNIENEKGDRLRLFLKLALYLNKQDTIFKRVPYLSVEAFENPKTRELLGLLYYRDLELVKAYNLIEDLSTPNSENIKGNILLAQKKWELAYAQFKLALKRKNNSQNALERIVPTAWRLNQWAEGVGYAARLEETPKNRDSKLALEAAFLTKDQRPKEALKKLDQIINKHTNSRAMEVNQLYAYNSMLVENKENTFDHADKACEQLDAFNCWLRAHLLIWEDFTLLAKRKDKVYEDTENILDKFKSGFEKSPIEESVYIDQKDIEELEDLQIDLTP